MRETRKIEEELRKVRKSACPDSEIAPATEAVSSEAVSSEACARSVRNDKSQKSEREQSER